MLPGPGSSPRLGRAASALDLERIRDEFFAGAPRYRFIDILGRGGRGVVFMARDMELGLVIAIKVIVHGSPVADAEFLDRAQREFHLNRQIRHRNVAQLHDFGISGSFSYFAMGLVPGEDLATIVCREGRLPPSRAVSILRQIVQGAAAAHDQGILHRDLKSSNVMVDQRGAVVILDFGCAAREVDQPLAFEKVFGTPEYFSPEQASGFSVDARSDIYSIGVIAFEVLTGALPFVGSSPSETARMHVFTPLPRLLDTIPDVPADLRAVVHRCLEKNVLDRFQDARELERALSLVAKGLDRLSRATSAAKPGGSPSEAVGKRRRSFLSFFGWRSRP